MKPVAKPSSSYGPWLVLAAAMLWGTTGTSQALAPAGAQPLAIGALRMAIGGMGLLILALARRSFKHGQRWPLGSTLLAGICVAAYQVFFFQGVARAGVALGTIVGIGSAPIFGGALGFIFHREPPTWRWVAATSLAIAGAALLVSGGSDLQVDVGGIFLAVGAGFVYAAYVTFSKNLLANTPPEAVMAVLFTLAALFLLPFLLSANLAWLQEPRGLAVAAHLGLLATALAYYLFGQGLRHTSVGTATTLTLAEPLTAGLLGIFLLGERLTLLAGLGILFIFGGLALLTLKKNGETSL